MKKMTNSFSLIEVLIFTSILSVFFVISLSIITISLRRMKINEHKILATHMAGQLMEWLRDEKETDWEQFVNRANGVSYCFNNQNFSWPVVGTCSSYNGITGIAPSIFKRYVTITANNQTPPTEVTVVIKVDWQEGADGAGNNTIYTVPLTTKFNLWE